MTETKPSQTTVPQGLRTDDPASLQTTLAAFARHDRHRPNTLGSRWNEARALLLDTGHTQESVDALEPLFFAGARAVLECLAEGRGANGLRREVAMWHPMLDLARL